MKSSSRLVARLFQRGRLISTTGERRLPLRPQLRTRTNFVTEPPPGPPQDPAPLPQNEKGVESLPGLTKTGSSILFPWIYANHPPRITNYPYPEANFWLPIIAQLPLSIQHKLSRALSMYAMKDFTSSEYFSDQFLLGAVLATNQVCLSLSTPCDLSHLSSTLTTRLYDRYALELEKLAKEGSSVNLSVPNVYDARIRDVWLYLGPRIAFSKSSREFAVGQWMTINEAVRIPSNNTSDEPISSLLRKAGPLAVYKTMMEGVQAKVDVEIDADVVYKLKTKDDVYAIDDQTRRTMVIRFETPYFEPAINITEGFAPVVDKETGFVTRKAPTEGVWQWRVGDIDYLLEAEDLEATESKREEKQRKHGLVED
ncbi:3738_t:CDS:2 [Paraglomus occultum]|uniref:3738_t:CDS:1 n=1 Tax=Paraglomus occultum TaxID=144539 RepID=A0A9N8ZC83_9GLOM|nr:3738_t:CDS:2 [Paraglomus occultum]